ncbi:hypothetical protein QU600_001847 [Orientia tsutsugamushi]|uniref:hypothetical protein n=1 Tax=Orientia tsutsugamushi TaxID=784 RepID=UPI00315D3C22
MNRILKTAGYFTVTGIIWSKSRYDFNYQKSCLDHRLAALTKNKIEENTASTANLKECLITCRGYTSIAASTSAALGYMSLVKIFGTISTSFVYTENILKNQEVKDSSYNNSLSNSIHVASFVGCIITGLYQYKSSKFLFNNKYLLPSLIAISMINFSFANFQKPNSHEKFINILDQHKHSVEINDNTDEVLSYSIKIRTVLSTCVTLNAYFKHIPAKVIKPFGFFMLAQALFESYISTQQLEQLESYISTQQLEQLESYISTQQLEQQNKLLGEYLEQDADQE